MLLKYSEFTTLNESASATASASPVKILVTSSRGAHLITDGSKVCWVMGKMVRPDGTLTPSGQEAMDNATKTLVDWELENKDKEAWKEKQAKEKEERFQNSKLPVECWIPADSFAGETDKAFKIWNGNYQKLYGKQVKSYEFIPKSQVTIVKKDTDRVVLSMPEWLRKKFNFNLV